MADLDFNQRVYRIVRRVPPGMVTTYGSIAAAMGDPRKAREVGWALHAKPREELAPAHRVVNREGRLSGGWAFGSPEIQRGLLEGEHVTFLADGRVNLSRHLWHPEEEPGGPEGQQLPLIPTAEEDEG